MQEKYPLSRKMKKIIALANMFTERDVDKLTPELINNLNKKTIPSSRLVRRLFNKPAPHISKTTYVPCKSCPLSFVTICFKSSTR